MNNLTSETKASRQLVPADRSVLLNGKASLEEMLVLLSRYGKPRIAHDGDGWYCSVAMYVSAVGVDFKVASEFSCPTPLIAATQCAERLDKALRDLGA